MQLPAERRVSEDPGWSVELQKAGFINGTANADDAFKTDALDTTADRTVWSIGAGKGAASGSWEAQMYDETASGAADDGSNVPTSVVGSFESSIGSTHSMVGAFGADKQ